MLDVASSAEIAQCLGLGVSATRLSFGHTVKTTSAIADAHAAGITAFACDSLEELAKIARHAPGAHVSVRLLTHGAGAEWPLSKKFGCDPMMACDLLLRARALGLTPTGVTFHVGSQQTDPGQWDEPIALAADVFRCVRAQGIRLHSLNLGGGFPAHYTAAVRPIEDYGAAIARSLWRHFGRHQPRIIVEPSRYLVADAGVIQAEVVLVSRKSYDDDTRVYLDCGKFGGLAETMDEAIKYRFHVPGRSGQLTRVILAGPTCDSADILYERTPCCLPADLRISSPPMTSPPARGPELDAHAGLAEQQLVAVAQLEPAAATARPSTPCRLRRQRPTDDSAWLPSDAPWFPMSIWKARGCSNGLKLTRK